MYMYENMIICSKFNHICLRSCSCLHFPHSPFPLNPYPGVPALTHMARHSILPPKIKINFLQRFVIQRFAKSCFVVDVSFCETIFIVWAAGRVNHEPWHFARAICFFVSTNLLFEYVSSLLKFLLYFESLDCLFSLCIKGGDRHSEWWKIKIEFSYYT